MTIQTYDKKQALGFILIIMVVMIYSQMVVAPYQTAPQPAPAQSSAPGASTANQAGSIQPSIQNSQISNSAANSATAGADALIRIPSLQEFEQAAKSVVHTGVSTVEISHLGARIKKLEINNAKKELNGSELLNLIMPVEGSSFPGALQYGAISDEGLLYSVREISGFQKDTSGALLIPQGNSASVTLSASHPTGTVFTKSFQFKSGSYLFNIESAGSTTSATAPQNISLSWFINVDSEALHQRFDPYFFSSLAESNKVSHIPALNDLNELQKPQSMQWLAFGDRYFNTAILPVNKQQTMSVQSRPGTYTITSGITGNSISIGVFAGPKVYQMMKSLGLQLERTIDLGFFAIVAYPLLQLLKFLYAIFGNYGVAIVALTLIVKTLFYPLNKASLKSMRAMQELSPEIAALRERVKDSTQLNQEMLALYKRKGVNPMGGCLPVLIQIPVFFGLYSSLQNAVELRHAPFALWVNDLATPEKLYFLGINFPIMIITMGAIMFIQQYRTPMPNMEPAQRKMMLGMSLVFTLMFLIFPFPAGLALYMLVNTTISLVQQQCIKSETMNRPFQATLAASAAMLVAAFVISKV